LAGSIIAEDLENIEVNHEERFVRSDDEDTAEGE
jgi:hypothetical protein